ncbi:MAG: DUF3108 domain-containing protein [Arenimonas sp.]|uniref:DUF3108 domain-containing protein n=1 Tax=Arenimonas sp. TaxID=1872635 RepID=UPI0025C26A3F|nr:DUF3108 domain-containing protein [Arenimonas sp.]MBW8367416.1 DUF3108 domain-containing protein [Arenimonas sp.]
MRFFLLCLALLLPAAAHAAPPAPFSADYEVFQNDKKLGRGTITLRALPGGQWEMVTRSEATQGLASAAGVTRNERSVLSWAGGKPEVVEYRMDQKAAWTSRNLHLRVDAAARRASSTYKDKTTPLPYRPGMLDRHGLTAAIMADLAAGARSGTPLHYDVASRDNVEKQHYSVAAAVKLRTSVGVMRAVRVERIREAGNGRVTKIWFARERGWLPLRIKQYEADGETLDMRIVAIR